MTEGPDSQRNFLVVDSKTETSEIERAFQSFTQERKDIAVLLINQHVGQHTSSLLKASSKRAQSFICSDTLVNYRSQSAFATASISSPILSPLFLRSPARTTRTTPRRTAFSSACAACLESRDPGIYYLGRTTVCLPQSGSCASERCSMASAPGTHDAGTPYQSSDINRTGRIMEILDREDTQHD